MSEAKLLSAEELVASRAMVAIALLPFPCKPPGFQEAFEWVKSALATIADLQSRLAPPGTERIKFIRDKINRTRACISGDKHNDYAWMKELHDWCEELLRALDAATAENDQLEKALDHSNKRFTSAEAELQKLREERGWQDISTAPKDGTPVDLWCEGFRHVNCKWGRHDAESNAPWGIEHWRGLGTYRLHGIERALEPSHWRLPPAPPTGSQPVTGKGE